MKTSREYLEKYANQIKDKHYPTMPRVIVNISKLKPHLGGMAYGSHMIVLPKWMLSDKEQSKSTIRHELAHNIIKWLKIRVAISHGKEFHQILKQIAPRTWRNDLHWTTTPAITQARQKAGIKTIKREPLKVRLFTCGNPDCPATPKHRYGWKRIPYYIKAGLFARCKECGCPTLVEIRTPANKDKELESFTSVHLSHKEAR